MDTAWPENEMELITSEKITSRYAIWNAKYEYWLIQEAENYFFLYAPTLRLALQVNKENFLILKSGHLPHSIEERLQKAQSNEIMPIIPPNTAFHLGLGLTRNCTMHCLYCHAEADIDKTIDWDIISAAIYYAFESAGKTPNKILSVSFAVGGEPTLPWDLFVKVVLMMRQLEKEKYKGVQRLFLSMTTNGYYGLEKRRFIASNFDSLTISLDGDRSIQDYQRPNLNGLGTYNIVSESIKFFLKKPDLRMGIRATVSSYSVNKLSQIVTHFQREFSSGITVAFEPMVSIGRASQTDLINPPDMELFLSEYRAAKKIGKKSSVNVVCSSPSITRLIRRFCGAISIPSFTLCVDGKITACHRDKDGSDYGYGNIDPSTHQIVLNRDRMEAIAKLNELPMQCQTCFAKYNCAGDCPDLRRIGFNRCEFNRSILFDQIKELLTNQIKGGE